MSKPSPDSPWRGCAANFEMPLTQKETEAAQKLVDTVHRVNCIERNPRLAGIQYRGGYGYDCDIIRSVFRWDTRPFQEIFQNGFQTFPVPGNSSAYNLYDFVQNASAQLLDDPNMRRRYGFVSTTISRSWHPQPSVETLPGGGEIQVYRYEIYAPGGIWVRLTLGSEHTDTSHADVCFVGGIAPHYIRSAQLFTITRPTFDPATQLVPQATYERAENELIINGHFNPLLNEDKNLRIQSPVFCYGDGNEVQGFLSFETYTPTTRRQKRQVSSDKWDTALKWYGHDIGDVPSYINAAFRSAMKNMAYLFMKNEYVLFNYARATTNDGTALESFLICGGYPSLMDTTFGEHGIDCAFDTDDTKALIFSANLCAYIDYAPMDFSDKILSGPMTITDIFPFFKGTVFEDGIDAAFRSSKNKEAYLFKGSQYALIHYESKRLIHIMNINDGFPSLLGTVFESGIDAAFASHTEPEAYLFKGAYYALINFAPHSIDDYIIGGRIKRILDHWPNLQRILPHKNHGLDVHTHSHENHHIQFHGCMII